MRLSSIASLVALSLLGAGCGKADSGVERTGEVRAVSSTDVPATSEAASTLPPPSAPPSSDFPPSTVVPTTSLDPATTLSVLEAATPGAEGAGDEYFPTYGNGGYDVESYDIDLTWNPMSTAVVHNLGGTSGNRIEATATIQATATQALSSFNLELSGLEVSAITVDGVAATFTREGLELTVDPATDIANGSIFRTAVTYGGEPQVQMGLSREPGGWFSDGQGGAYVFGEPEGAATWFPVNDTTTDKAEYHVTVTAANGLTVAANGNELRRVDNGDTTTWEFGGSGPMAPYLATVIIGDYEVVDGGTSTSGVKIRNVFPRGQVEEYTAAFAKQAEMIDVFEKWFGPYPFEVYGSAVLINFGIGAALETQTLSLFSELAVDDSVIAHELAHQWFGDSVSLSQWSDVWLNEGFATYGETIWREASEPQFDASAAFQGAARQFAGELGLPPGDPGPTKLFEPSVYVRGAMTVHAVRVAIGDDAFRELLTTYHRTFGGSTASTSDFQALAEQISAQQLDDLFEQWLYAPELPDELDGLPLD